MEHIYEKIIGWFDFQEVYTKMVKEAKDGDVFVEIGTANGKSASFMAVEIANSGKKIEFHTVDIFPSENEQFHQEELVRKLLEPFDNVFVHKCDSCAFLKQLKDKSISFIFIDGKHEINPLIFEMMLAYTKLKKGTYMGGHDYWESFLDVKKTADSFCEFMNLKITQVDKSFLIKI